ncbi:UbiA prenyltransferase family protein [Candidatus Woesearchaeota archaeon]|nr:UbiA prenyltransferase family protein [Candidatus Woesearchaeota archaeon]
MHPLISALRLHQWYKNLLIFLPIIFSGHLLNVQAFFLTFVGCALLCVLSSGNYCINDFFDWKRDKWNPDKKQKLSRNFLLVLGLILVIFSLYLSLKIFPAIFTVFLFSLFVTTFLYSAILKLYPFVDILIIAVNFVLRAVSGAFVIVESSKPYVWVSPWLIICTFFLALFIAVGKRYVEFAKHSNDFRPTLQSYTPELTKSLMIIATSCLIISYTLYSFLGENKNMIFTLPFALYTIFTYLGFIYNHSKIAEKSHLVVTSPKMIAGILLWVVATLIILYL